MSYTRIKGGFSEHRRIPRLGKIRLGLKVEKKRQDGSTVQYPTETKYFVVPPEVQDVYGAQPTELDVMLPSDNADDVFPQSLSWFGRTAGLKCKGDMETAERKNEETGAWEKRTCPCEHYKSDENPKGECTESGILITILPKVNMGGTYQLRTGSYHSVVDINSGLDYIRALIGRIAMVPLKLRRVARDTHADGKKQTHYTLSLVMDANIDGVNQLRNDTTRILSSAQLLIEAPEEENPILDKPDMVIEDAEEQAEMEEQKIAAVQEKLTKKKTAVQGDGLVGSAPYRSMTTGETPTHQAEAVASTIKILDAPAPSSAPPVEGLDAQWLSHVMDAEDYLRGTVQGKNSLRSIRAGFKLGEGVYPMLPDDQRDYLADLNRTVERLEKAKSS